MKQKRRYRIGCARRVSGITFIRYVQSQIIDVLVFCVIFCRQMCCFFFFLPLYCLSFFDLLYLITSLVSSKVSYYFLYTFFNNDNYLISMKQMATAQLSSNL